MTRGQRAAGELHPIRTTRDRIVETAARLFSSNGFHQTSIDEVAQEAGVAKGSVYYHFTGKDHLLVSVIQEGVRLIQETVEERLDAFDDALARLLTVLGVSYDVMTEYAELARFALLGECEGVSCDAKKQIDAAREAFESDIVTRVKEVVGDALDAIVTAHILVGALEGAVRAASSSAGVARATRSSGGSRASGAGRSHVTRDRSRDRVRETLLKLCEKALAEEASISEDERVDENLHS